jgi:polar amino acid transport system permease protein
MHKKKSPVTLLDGIILACILAFFSYLIYRLFFSLNYNWNWGVIPTYLFRFDNEAERWTSNVLVEGFVTTIKLSVWATLFALIIGVTIGLMRVSPRLFFNLIGRTYIETIRNTPPLVLVFIFYFFVSDQLLTFLGVEDLLRAASETSQAIVSIFFTRPGLITQFFSGVLTLALFQGAYIAEIVRAGIQAIDTGQWEAGAALGLTRWQLMRLIVLPQATKIMLPPLANEFINTIKWSSIVSIISIQELTFQGMQVMASTQATIEVWLTISSMYLILCLVLSLAVRGIEHYLSRSERVMSTYQQTGP